MIYENFTDIFPYDKFPVEYECYKQLKDYKNLNYIALPWTQILNSGWLDFPNKKDTNYYFQEISKMTIEQDNNFTICQHDNYCRLTDIFRHLKINKVFTPLHNKNFKTNGIEYIPLAFTNSFDFEKKIKDILFSFVGASTTHYIRENMKNKIFGTNIIYRDGYHVESRSLKDSNFRKKEENEYRDILERSRFSLCPRGSSPSSVRFWESLAAGAIPILISDDWELPEWDWKNTILKISESTFLNPNVNYDTIKMHLEKIPKEKEELMKKNCVKAYNFYKKENYKNYILSKI